MIAAAIAALGFAGAAPAQQDAAEKAKEGGIDHWIEYYKGQQRKPAPANPQESEASSVDRAAPVERNESGGLPRDKAERR